MTRLTTKDIEGLKPSLISYEYALKQKTGASLQEIACFAADLPREKFLHAANEKSVAVIPVTTGQGLIGGFVQAVQSIISHIGFEARITRQTDVAGLAEAFETGASMAFMADDNRFIAINLRTGILVDNAVATARGYVAALNFMAKGLKNRHVLVLGVGRVGVRAVDFLLDLGASVAVFDPDPQKTDIYVSNEKVTVKTDLYNALAQYSIIFDASPEPASIRSEDLPPQVIIAAPGIPLGLTREALEVFKERLIHDPLQLGVAAMTAMAVK